MGKAEESQRLRGCQRHHSGRWLLLLLKPPTAWGYDTQKNPMFVHRAALCPCQTRRTQYITEKPDVCASGGFVPVPNEAYTMALIGWGCWLRSERSERSRSLLLCFLGYAVFFFDVGWGGGVLTLFHPECNSHYNRKQNNEYE